MTGERAAFTVAVCGSGNAPAWFVRSRLGAVTRRRAHGLAVVIGAEESAVRAWVESATLAGRPVELVYVPCSASPATDLDWVAVVAALVDAVVIFGDPMPWWRLHSAAFARGLPVRHFVLPRPVPLTGAGPGGYPD